MLNSRFKKHKKIRIKESNESLVDIKNIVQKFLLHLSLRGEMRKLIMYVNQLWIN